MKSTILLVALSFLFANTTLAHRGRTNSEGCHNNRKTGGYHCHGVGSNYSSRSRATKSINSYSGLLSKSSLPSISVPAPDQQLVSQIQKHLNVLGYKAGKENGLMSTKTQKAISRFQVDNGTIVNGRPSYSLLEMLKAKVNG